MQIFRDYQATKQHLNNRWTVKNDEKLKKKTYLVLVSILQLVRRKYWKEVRYYGVIILLSGKGNKPLDNFQISDVMLPWSEWVTVHFHLK